jgi:predicted Zn-dependent protease
VANRCKLLYFAALILEVAVIADDQRLDGWKSIANFLGRERTTAFRWASERGLPIHRVPGGRTGTVYALRSELEAWLSSDGPDLDDPVGRTTPSNVEARVARPARKRICHALMALFAVVACFAVTGWWMFGRASAYTAAPVSIAAVASPTDNAESIEFVRALTSDLARFANASSSLAIFEREPGAAPDTQYAVRTEIERKNNKIFALTRLIAVDSGEVLWSQRFEQSDPALSTLREQIAANIVGMLTCSFGKLDDERSTPRTADMAQLIAICQDVDDDNLTSAQAHARQLTQSRPDLAIGWAWLAVVQGWMIDKGDDTLRGQAIANALRTKKIAPDKACTWLAQAAVARGGFSGPNALPFIEQGLRMHPDHPTLLSHYSMVLFDVGYVKDSVAPALNALRSDPSSLYSRDVAVRRLAAAGRTREALKLQHENEQLWPGHPRPMATRAQLFLDTASLDTADRDAIATDERKVAEDPFVAYRLAYYYERIGNRRLALDWLAQAPVKNAYLRWTVLLLPDAAELRTEPAFFRKMADLGLVRWWVTRKQWPDFCAEPGLKYDCATEARRLGMIS